MLPRQQLVVWGMRTSRSFRLRCGSPQLIATSRHKTRRAQSLSPKDADRRAQRLDEDLPPSSIESTAYNSTICPKISRGRIGNGQDVLVIEGSPMDGGLRGGRGFERSPSTNESCRVQACMSSQCTCGPCPHLETRASRQRFHECSLSFLNAYFKAYKYKA